MCFEFVAGETKLRKKIRDMERIEEKTFAQTRMLMKRLGVIKNFAEN